MADHPGSPFWDVIGEIKCKKKDAEENSRMLRGKMDY